MMNVRLADGTVRCADCLDASSYVEQTAEPCIYCGATPELITIPVIMSDPETGDTVSGWQQGEDVDHVLWNLDEATGTPGGLWFGWEYVALV